MYFCSDVTSEWIANSSEQQKVGVQWIDYLTNFLVISSTSLNAMPPQPSFVMVSRFSTGTFFVSYHIFAIILFSALGGHFQGTMIKLAGR